jgi:hypothetical protein
MWFIVLFKNYWIFSIQKCGMYSIIIYNVDVTASINHWIGYYKKKKNDLFVGTVL